MVFNGRSAYPRNFAPGFFLGIKSNVLQCVAVRCSVLQCIDDLHSQGILPADFYIFFGLICNTYLWHTATYCNKRCVLQCVAECCRVLRPHLLHTAARVVLSPTFSRCNSLQLTATHYNALQNTATRCSILQHSATHVLFALTRSCPATQCNTLQHTATHCNTIQHAATQCNTL